MHESLFWSVMSDFLYFLNYTNRTIWEIPWKGIYIFTQYLSKCLYDIPKVKQFPSAKPSVSKTSNFILRLDSMGSLKGNTQKERGCPNDDWVSPILLLRGQQHWGKTQNLTWSKSLPAGFKRAQKNLTIGLIYWHSWKGFGHYRKKHH